MAVDPLNSWGVSEKEVESFTLLVCSSVFLNVIFEHKGLVVSLFVFEGKYSHFLTAVACSCLANAKSLCMSDGAEWLQFRNKMF